MSGISSGDERSSLTPDVLIIGGGAIGLAVAAACRRAGFQQVVTIEQAGRLASGASGSNGGAIAPDMHLLTDRPELVAFGRRSRELYREWDEDWNGALGLWPTRWLNLFPYGEGPLVSRQAPSDIDVSHGSGPRVSRPAPSDIDVSHGSGPRVSRPAPSDIDVSDGSGPRVSRPAPSNMDVSHGDGPPASRPAPGDITRRPLPPEFRVLSEDDLKELEPDVRLPDGGTAVLVDGQLGVNPQRLAAALSTRAGTVFTGVRMLEITKSGTVRTTAGDFTPGAIVLATGLLPKPWQTRQRWVKGHMVAVAPGPWRLNSVLAGPLGGGTPLSDGTIFCGGTFDEGDSSPDVRPEIADSLAEGLARVLPKAAGARVSHRWCCFRPYIEGRQPVIDRLPDVPNGWFAGGHFTTGIMMAAATGEAVAQWIATGTAPDLVRTFTLDR